MKLFGFSVFFTLVVASSFYQQVQGTTVVSTTTTTKQPPTASPRDMHDDKRKVIQGLAKDLQKLADDGKTSVENFNRSLATQSGTFLDGVRRTLTEILQRIQNSIQNIINNGNQNSNAVRDCLNNQMSSASALIDSTMQTLGNCARDVSQSINAFLVNLSYSLDNVRNTLLYLLAEVPNCGVATINNFLTVGSCLNNLINMARWSLISFSGQLATGITEVVTSIAVLPINFAFCSAQNVPAGVQSIGIILNNLGQCTAMAVGK